MHYFKTIGISLNYYNSPRTCKSFNFAVAAEQTLPAIRHLKHVTNSDKKCMWQCRLEVATQHDCHQERFCLHAQDFCTDYSLLVHTGIISLRGLFFNIHCNRNWVYMNAMSVHIYWTIVMILAQSFCKDENFLWSGFYCNRSFWDILQWGFKHHKNSEIARYPHN